jgi:hypothetical protein
MFEPSLMKICLLVKKLLGSGEQHRHNDSMSLSLLKNNKSMLKDILIFVGYIFVECTTVK